MEPLSIALHLHPDLCGGRNGVEVEIALYAGDLLLLVSNLKKKREKKIKFVVTITVSREHEKHITSAHETY